MDDIQIEEGNKQPTSERYTQEYLQEPLFVGSVWLLCETFPIWNAEYILDASLCPLLTVDLLLL
jgi:hypothetical protein